jgi:hypothetical protein
MRKAESTLTVSSVAFPTCAKCGSVMSLTKIEPDALDHDLRTFDCPECANSVVDVVKYR